VRGKATRLRAGARVPLVAFSAAACFSLPLVVLVTQVVVRALGVGHALAPAIVVVAAAVGTAQVQRCQRERCEGAVRQARAVRECAVAVHAARWRSACASLAVHHTAARFV